MAWTALYYHIVFSTKDRRASLTEEIRPRVSEYAAGILRNVGGHLAAGGGTADHVHVAVELPPTQAVADAVRVVKTNLSKWVHNTFPRAGAFAWQESYAAFTVSKSALPEVTAYIDRQGEHHRVRNYVDELRALLVKHGVEFDERYLA